MGIEDNGSIIWNITSNGNRMEMYKRISWEYTGTMGIEWDNGNIVRI